MRYHRETLILLLPATSTCVCNYETIYRASIVRGTLRDHAFSAMGMIWSTSRGPANRAAHGDYLLRIMQCHVEPSSTSTITTMSSCKRRQDPQASTSLRKIIQPGPIRNLFPVVVVPSVASVTKKVLAKRKRDMEAGWCLRINRIATSLTRQ
jgi:hypothetical protein